MKKQLFCICFFPFFLTAFQTRGSVNFITPQNSDQLCVNQVVGNNEIVARKTLDIDKSGALDEVILYKDDLLYILIVLSPLSANCEVVLKEPFTSLALASGQQTVNVHEIKLIELTGDNQPELYVWVDKEGGGRFVSAAVHVIYKSSVRNWEEALHIEQCLAFNSFNFRNTEIDNIKNIYRDSDIICEPPFSTNRNYEIYKWNGSEYESIEKGNVVVRSLYPLVWYPICVTMLISSFLIFAMIVIGIRKRDRPR